MNKIYLAFTVVAQTVRRTDTQRVVAGAYNVYWARFDFSDAWDGLNKTAVFKQGPELYNAEIDANGECEVPWEVLASQGAFSVGAYGGEIITTDGAEVMVSEALIDGGEYPAEPTQGLIPAAVEAARAYRDAAAASAQQATTNAETAAEASKAAQQAEVSATGAAAQASAYKDAAEQSATSSGDSAALAADKAKDAAASATAALLAAIASGDGGIKFSSFKDLQKLTRLGLASKVLAVGDQIVNEKASTTTATVGNSEGGHGITAATVNRDTFIHAIGTSHNGVYEFRWDGAVWHFGDEAVELSTYGITITGTPVVGDEIVVHETASTLVWDVLGIDCDTPADSQFTHSITLGLHDCIAGLQFDAREALFYCPDGLAAGTYNFKVTQHTWVSSDVNKTFQFTLTQAVPAGGQIVLQVSRNVTIAGSTLKTYASASATTEIETATITEGTGGTSLGDVNNAINGNTNSLQRGLLGNNRYSVSAMRQWLNSNSAAGSVWTPQTNFDRPPTWVTSTAGFLNGLDADFKAAIGTVSKTTAHNTVTDGGGSNNSTEQIFLVSRSEVFGGNENSIAEGAAYPYYANYSDLAAPGTEDDTNRIKYRTGAAQYWWLRTPYSSYATEFRTVTPTGNIISGSAGDSNGVVPACCIV